MGGEQHASAGELMVDPLTQKKNRNDNKARIEAAASSASEELKEEAKRAIELDDALQYQNLGIGEDDGVSHFQFFVDKYSDEQI